MRHNGGRSPDEIMDEMERTRAEMDTTLTAIELRLSPGQLFDQGLHYLRSSGGAEFFSNLGGSAKQNPMPVALVGIGLAWLMASGRPARAGASATSNAMHRAGEKAQQAKARIDSMMHEQPLALGAVGLAVGALLAACTPRTRHEDRLVGEARDRLAEKVKAEAPERIERAAHELGATSEPARSAAKIEPTPSQTQPRRQK